MSAYTDFCDALEEGHLFHVPASFHCLCLSTGGAAGAALVVERARLAAELLLQR